MEKYKLELTYTKLPLSHRPFATKPAPHAMPENISSFGRVRRDRPSERTVMGESTGLFLQSSASIND